MRLPRRFTPRHASLKHARRPTESDSLEEQIPKAKSSMVAAAISPNLVLNIATDYYGSGDDYDSRLEFVFLVKFVSNEKFKGKKTGVSNNLPLLPIDTVDRPCHSGSDSV
jgi:hypothetical protein